MLGKQVSTIPGAATVRSYGRYGQGVHRLRAPVAKLDQPVNGYAEPGTVGLVVAVHYWDSVRNYVVQWDDGSQSIVSDYRVRIV